jgi:hypothetical protein
LLIFISKEQRCTWTPGWTGLLEFDFTDIDIDIDIGIEIGIAIETRVSMSAGMCILEQFKHAAGVCSNVHTTLATPWRG